MDAKKIAIILIHAFIGWALCAATIGIGSSLTSMSNTLIIHAILAPIFFIIISTVYFRKFAYTKPLTTALIFLAFVMAVDAGLVAPVFVKSYAMFQSFLGTWLPFILIFLATYLTGLLVKNK